MCWWKDENLLANRLAILRLDPDVDLYLLWTLECSHQTQLMLWMCNRDSVPLGNKIHGD